jgi:hypothetical protein
MANGRKDAVESKLREQKSPKYFSEPSSMLTGKTLDSFSSMKLLNSGNGGENLSPGAKVGTDKRRCQQNAVLPSLAVSGTKTTRTRRFTISFHSGF